MQGEVDRELSGVLQLDRRFDQELPVWPGTLGREGDLAEVGERPLEREGVHRDGAGFDHFGRWLGA